MDIRNIIQALDVRNIYEIPSLFFKEKLDERVLSSFKVKNPKQPNLLSWNNITKKQNFLKKNVEIGIVGKYIELKDAYKSLVEALIHSGIKNNTKIKINWIDAGNLKILKKYKKKSGNNSAWRFW